MFIKKACCMLIILLSTHTILAYQSGAERELSKQLTAAVAEVNSRTPWKLDEDTRLDSAATTSNYIIYTNTLLNYSVEQLDIVQFDKIIIESVIGSLCANKDLKSFIELKVIMVYRYLDKNGQYVSELSKDMASCN